MDKYVRFAHSGLKGALRRTIVPISGLHIRLLGVLPADLLSIT